MQRLLRELMSEHIFGSSAKGLMYIQASAIPNILSAAAMKRFEEGEMGLPDLYVLQNLLRVSCVNEVIKTASAATRVLRQPLTYCLSSLQETRSSSHDSTRPAHACASLQDASNARNKSIRPINKEVGMIIKEVAAIGRGSETDAWSPQQELKVAAVLKIFYFQREPELFAASKGATISGKGASSSSSSSSGSSSGSGSGSGSGDYLDVRSIAGQVGARWTGFKNGGMQRQMALSNLLDACVC